MRELKRYKQELAVIGLLSLVLMLVRWVGSTFWPTTGQYDLAAQTETVVYTALRMIAYSLLAWLGLRAVAPKAYNFLKHEVIDQFDKLPWEVKVRYSMRMFCILFAGLVLLAMSGCTPAQAATSTDQRTCVMLNAAADVGVREATGRNDGPEVERYLAHVGLGKGNAWCAAFVCYHLSRCEVSNPRSAWSPAVASGGKLVWQPRKAARSPLPGDVFSVYYPKLNRVGHVGLVSGVDGRHINTIEGNTSGPGSREGDGVYARRREMTKLHGITSYIHSDGATGARTSARLPEQTAHRNIDDHRAYGGPFRRVAARHQPDGTSGARQLFGALARSWDRLASAYRTERARMVTGTDHQRHPVAQWRVRQRHVRSYAVGQVAAGGQLPQSGDNGPGDRDRGGHTQVGVVEFGRRSGSTPLALLAIPHPHPQSPVR